MQEVLDYLFNKSSNNMYQIWSNILLSLIVFAARLYAELWDVLFLSMC